MKKRIVIFLVYILTVGLCPAVGAEETYLFEDYGAKCYENDFDEATDTAITGYPYFISGTAGLSVTEAVCRSGKAIQLQLSDMKTQEAEDVLFSFHDSEVEPAKEYFYAELYIKGFAELPESLIPQYTYNAGTAPIIKYGSEPAEDGWIRLWFVIPPLEQYEINGHVGFRYTRAAGDPNTIWVDDFSMRAIPAELVLTPRSCTNAEPFDLSLTPATGYSAEGVRHTIENRHLIHWSVKSGDAVIENNMLTFTATAPQKVVLKADFFSVEAEVTLEVDAYAGTYPLDAGSMTAEITKGTQSYTATVENSGKERSVYMVVASYRDGKLYKTAVTETIVPADGKAVLECAIPAVPAMLGGTVASRAFLWNDAVGSGIVASEPV